MSVPEDRTKEKPPQECQNEVRHRVARHRVLKGAQIVFKGHEAVTIVWSSTCRTGAPASKWKLPSEFPRRLILCLTTHSSAIAA